MLRALRALRALPSWALWLASGAVLLAWLPIGLSVDLPYLALSILMEIQLVGVVIALFLRRYRKLALVILLLSPVHARFWGGAHRYALGKAYYLTKGSMPGGNLDEVRRVPLVTVASSDSTLQWWLWFAPQNAAVDLCFGIFGPMPGAYDGPIPSNDTSLPSDQLPPEDIDRIVRESSLDVQLSALLHDPIQIGDAVVTIRRDIVPRMIEAMMGGVPDDRCLSRMTARVALWRERVLIVAVPWSFECFAPREDKDQYSFAAAVDTRSGRVLGYYHLHSLLGNSASDLAGVWHLKFYGGLESDDRDVVRFR